MSLASLAERISRRAWVISYKTGQKIYGLVHRFQILTSFSSQAQKSKTELREFGFESIDVLAFKDSKQFENIKVLLLSPRNDHNDSRKFENVFTFNTEKAIQDYGVPVRQYWPSESSLQDSSRTSEIQAEIQSIIETESISFIFADLNIGRKYESISREFLSKLKIQFEIKIIFLSFDWSSAKFRHWNEIADLFTSNSPSRFDEISFVNQRKLLALPSIIYPESRYPTDVNKSLDFAFYGSQSRRRDFYLKKVNQLLQNTEIVFNIPSQNSEKLTEKRNLSIEGYINQLAKARMTFSNGFDSPFHSHITNRFIEAVLVKTICLYEFCDDLAYFFPNHADYISIKSRRDLHSRLKYFNKNRELVRLITEQMRESYISNYSSEKVLTYIFSRQY